MDGEAKLLIVRNGKDEDGFPVEKKEEIPVFVNEISATRNEFYEALRAGISIKTVLEIRWEDWELSRHKINGKKAYATQIEYDDSVYDIARTYRKGKSTIELICS